MATAQLEHFRHSISLLRAMARDRATNVADHDTQSLLLDWARALEAERLDEPQPGET